MTSCQCNGHTLCFRCPFPRRANPSVDRVLKALSGNVRAEVPELANCGGPDPWHVSELTAAARRLVGQWPTAGGLTGLQAPIFSSSGRWQDGHIRAARDAMGVLAGKGALVTGGSCGIGRAIVKRLAADGAGVVFSLIADEAGRAACGRRGRRGRTKSIRAAGLSGRPGRCAAPVSASSQRFIRGVDLNHDYALARLAGRGRGPWPRWARRTGRIQADHAHLHRRLVAECPHEPDRPL